MRGFRILAVASAVGITLPIILGGVVRATGSGDACPDWPKCFGRWIPPANYQSILEYSHRVAAFVSGLMLLSLALWLLKDARLRKRPIVFPAVIAFALLILQSYLGKLVVERALSPLLVTFHLATALLLAATVATAAVNAFYTHDSSSQVNPPDPAGERSRSGQPVDAALVQAALVSAVFIFAVVLVGAYLRAENAGLVFSDWPLMDGTLLPGLDNEPERVHFAHRLLVLIGAAPVIWLVYRARRIRREVRSIAVFAHLTAGLYFLEVLVGAANVITRLSAWARATHVALSALAFMAATTCLALCVNEATAFGDRRRRAEEVMTT